MWQRSDPVSSLVRELGCSVRCFSTLLMIAALSFESAAAEEYSRPATEEDFAGIFKLLPYPFEDQPEALRDKIKDFWPADCQFFGHYRDGRHLQQQVHLGDCVNAIPASKPELPQVVTWKFVKPGFFLIERSDIKNYSELWKVDRVNRNTHLGAINLSQSDLVMQMLNKQTLEILWARILQKIGDVE